MRKKIILATTIVALVLSNLYSQKSEQDSTYNKYFIGSTFFILGNFIPDDPNRPDFMQLNFGYRLTPKDVISVEAKSWKYAWPLGIPYGSSFQSPEEKYPGYVREFGLAFVYQRFYWKGFYSAIHAMNTLQKYVDEDNKKIQNGYQLFLTGRLGYHFKFFKNRFFVEPSVAITYWPVNTSVPESFAKIESRWPNYFLLEPGLHFGIKF